MSKSSFKISYIKSKRRTRKIIILTCFLTILPLIFFGSNQNQIIWNIEYDFDKRMNLKTHGYWNLTGTLIFIDNKDPAFNWNKTANDNPWCSGLGTKEEPYSLENITIDAQNFDNCISIINSQVYFIINNCTLLNSDIWAAGIWMDNVTNGIIVNNNCSNNYDGIFLNECNNTKVIENIVSNNYRRGIFLYECNLTKIIENNVSNTDRGIALEHLCNNNTISINTLEECSFGISFQEGNNSNNIITDNIIKGQYPSSVGIIVGGKNNIVLRNTLYYSGIGIASGDTPKDTASHTIDTTNVVNGKPIYYYANKNHLKPSNFTNAGEILLVNCNYSLIANLDFEEVSTGIVLYYCDNNIIKNISIAVGSSYGIAMADSNNNLFLDNEVTHQDLGIYVLRSHNNSFHNNLIQNNFDGIVAVFCNNNTFSNNYIYNNSQEGFILDLDSNGNLFYHNYLINNTVNAIDNCNFNKWDNGLIGNYWDDYLGYDLNNNSIGDIPYNVSGTAESKDNFPIFTVMSPKITILKPVYNDLFGYETPEVDISVQGAGNLQIWYMIDNEIIFTDNYSFTGIINQEVWDLFGNGTLKLTFYANDSSGTYGSRSITLRKDILAPQITINNPNPLQEFNSQAPFFNLSIIERNLDTIWYSLDDGINNFTVSGLIGIINQDIWDGLPNGNVIIRFYANDTLGNKDYVYVIVIRNISQSSQKIYGYDLILLIGTISIVSIIIIKKLINVRDL